MKKFSGKIACGMLAAVLMAGSLAGCGKLDGTKTVATVDSETVTLGLASYMIRDQQAQTQNYYNMLAQSYGMDMSGGIWDEEGDDGKTYGESSKDDVLENIRQLYAIRAHAKEYDITITDEEKTKIQEAAKTFMESNDEETLEALAVSQSDIETYLELYTYREKMHDPMVADVDREVSDEEANQTKITFVKVSTAGTEKDDDGNVIDLTDEEKAEKKSLAEDVKTKVEASDNIAEADMDALAKEADESLSAAERDFTTAGEEDETLDQKVRDAALALEDGRLAPEVVEAEDGYYVVRLDLKFDEEGTKNKKDTIISEREQEAYDALKKEWTEAAELKVEKSVWKKVKVTDKQPYIYKTEEAQDSETDTAE